MSALHVGLFTECYRPIQNGIVASVDALAHALRANAHEATVVTPEMPGYEDATSGVVRVPSLPLPTSTAYRLTVPYLPKTSPNFSIVHAHSPFVTGWLGVREARRTSAPLVFTYHTQLEEYAHYFPFDTRVTRAAATQLTRSFANAADLVIVPTEPMERRLRDLGHNRIFSICRWACAPFPSCQSNTFQIRVPGDYRVEIQLDGFSTRSLVSGN